MSIKRLLTAIPVLLFLVILSCNLFEPREVDADKWYMTGEAWIIEGKKKMWDKDWKGAAKDFGRALDLDSSLSEGYFYLGKCVLRLNNVKLDQVWGDIKPDEGADEDRVPFLFRPDSGVSIKAPLSNKFETILYSVVVSGTDVTVQEEKFTADTLIDSVFLERKRIYDAVYQAIGYLEKIHTRKPMDSNIKRAQYESDYLVEISIKMILGIIDIDRNGKLDWDISKKERNAYRILCQDIPSLDDMDFDSLKTISKDPHDIKENLDLILFSLLQADSSYDNFLNDLKNGDMDTTMADDLGEMIDNFKKILPWFYYDDFFDNDLDYWDTNKNGKKDRMIWIDWNLDHKITVAENDSLHIGDSAHIKANPSLYEVVDPTDKDYERYRYKGGYNWEFIGGDWGCDEEILDGHDNDDDGLVDEDTRITADTLDDDGDWFNTNTSTNPNNAIGLKSFNPMKWESTTNFTVEITGTLWDTNVVINPRYILLHSKDYPIYNYDGTGKYPLPLKTKKFMGDTTNQAEFLGGDYGMDEEWFDGLDNDKDGLFDEDVGERLPPLNMRDALIQELTKLGLRGQ